MIYFILAAIIIAASILIAINNYRRARSTLQILETSLAAYIVQNPAALTPTFLANLFQNNHFQDFSLSFEVLFKGPSKALVLFGSKTLVNYFPQLNLLEIEDYTPTLEDSTIALAQIDQVNSGQPLAQTKLDLASILNLSPDMQFFWQLILTPNYQRSPAVFYQADFKAAIKTPEIATNQLVLTSLAQYLAAFNLQLTIDRQSQPNLLNSFQTRRPRPLSKLILSPSQVINLIKV